MSVSEEQVSREMAGRQWGLPDGYGISRREESCLCIFSTSEGNYIFCFLLEFVLSFEFLSRSSFFPFSLLTNVLPTCVCATGLPLVVRNKSKICSSFQLCVAVNEAIKSFQHCANDRIEVTETALMFNKQACM